MTTFHSTDWASQARADLSAVLRTAAKELLERKHLYQSVTIDLAVLKQRAASEYQGNRSIFEQELDRAQTKLWVPGQPQLPGVAASAKTDRDSVYIVFPTIKTFCRQCEGVEPNNLVYAHDVAQELMSTTGRSYHRATLQNFIVGYLCQACKITPEFFMVRREDLKLSVVGRSPMEHVNVPDVIPKQQRKYYSGAIVAFQSGQVLPALFMLRTFLEQFAASQVVDKALRADGLLAAYISTLPEPVRAHFVSPREMYAKLSEAIHAAREDIDLYSQVSDQIVEHFEARRLYRVTLA